MTLTEDITKLAIEAGFVSIGICSPKILHDLPYGWVDNVFNLRSPEEELPHVESVILMTHYAWDKSFNIAVDSTYLKDRNNIAPKVPQERYQLYYEVLKNKAWTIVEYLAKKGHETRISLNIPLKTSAVRCGLGSQGKNTLLITPNYGARIRLISVLTTAKLTADEPFKDDLCGECEKCISACPTKALKPYRIKINRCLTYAAEGPDAKDVPEDVREIEKRLTIRPTSNSYIECTICIEACPFGR
jgi:epoxyqueuosine reductase QueG